MLFALKKKFAATATAAALNLQGCDSGDPDRELRSDETLQSTLMLTMLIAAILAVVWLSLKLYREYLRYRESNSLVVPLKGIGKGRSEMVLSTAHIQRIENIAYERGLRDGIERAQGSYELDAWRLAELNRVGERYGRGLLGTALEREIRVRHEIQGSQILELRRWRENGVMMPSSDAARGKGKGPSTNAGKGRSKGRNGPVRPNESRNKGKGKPAAQVEDGTSTESGVDINEYRSEQSEVESDGGRTGSNRSMPSVGRTVMAGAIAASSIDMAMGSNELVQRGTSEVGLIESHTGYTGLIWLLLVYVVISLFRDLKSLIAMVLTFVKRHVNCLKREKPRAPLQKDDKVVVWTTKFGNKLHFSRECSFLEKSKATYGHEACAGCLRELEKFWCIQCSSTHETSCEIRKRYL